VPCRCALRRSSVKLQELLHGQTGLFQLVPQQALFQRFSLRACHQINVAGSHPVFTPSSAGTQSRNSRRSAATSPVSLNHPTQIRHKYGRYPLQRLFDDRPLCTGMDKMFGLPSLVSFTWLPFCPLTVHPARSNVFTTLSGFRL
jgi:hypothetical protein